MQSPNNHILRVPQFPQFIALSKVDRENYEHYIAKYEPYSDYGYTSLFVWGRNEDQFIALLNGNIVLSMKDYMSDKKILSFMGTHKVNETARVLLEFTTNNKDYEPGLYLIPELTAKRIRSKTITVTEDEDNNDYILATDLYMDLLGSDFSHVRRKLAHFNRANGDKAEVKEVSLLESHIQNEVKNLSLNWAFMGTEGSISAHEEIAAIQRLLTDIVRLEEGSDIRCLVLEVDGVIEGFCIYELKGDFAIVHFIKANLDLEGSADYMMINTMRHILTEHGVHKVNHEQDLGIAGLRAAKRHYRPAAYLKKYQLLTQ